MKKKKKKVVKSNKKSTHVAFWILNENIDR